MSFTLRFLGAAENVTGSRYLLEAGGTRLLVDCGLYQERELLNRNWDPFPVPPASLAAVLLTHAHLDHCGYLPRLVRDGFRGPVYGTVATAEIAKIALLDSAGLQAEDAAFKRRRHERERRKGPFPEIPLYSAADVEACCARFRPVPYEQPVSVADGWTVRFFEVGHILGATSIQVTVRQNGRARRVVFSGDVGRWDRPILRDPAPCAPADVVVMESTYGNRLHEAAAQIEDRLAEVVNDTHTRGGNLVIPSFAIERAQDVLYYLHRLQEQQRIPRLMVFMDSPMAISVTEVFERHAELVDEEMRALLREHRSPFHFPGLKRVQTPEDSKAINHIRGMVIILAGSGMCTGGRVKHHLVNNITRPESTILFVGYQAVGTLGRQIVDGAQEVRILGQMHPVRARVASLHGFSAHADRGELVRWLTAAGGRKPAQVLVTHGEPEVAREFAQTLAREGGYVAVVPRYGDTVDLGG